MKFVYYTFFKKTKVYKLHETTDAEQQILSSLNFAEFVVNGSCSLLLSCSSVLNTDMFVTKNVLMGLK